MKQLFIILGLSIITFSCNKQNHKKDGSSTLSITTRNYLTDSLMGYEPFTIHERDKNSHESIVMEGVTNEHGYLNDIIETTSTSRYSINFMLNNKTAVAYDHSLLTSGSNNMEIKIVPLADFRIVPLCYHDGTVNDFNLSYEQPISADILENEEYRTTYYRYNVQCGSYYSPITKAAGNWRLTYKLTDKFGNQTFVDTLVYLKPYIINDIEIEF